MSLSYRVLLLGCLVITIQPQVRIVEQLSTSLVILTVLKDRRVCAIAKLIEVTRGHLMMIINSSEGPSVALESCLGQHKIHIGGHLKVILLLRKIVLVSSVVIDHLLVLGYWVTEWVGYDLIIEEIAMQEAI